jgi:hypothetical protein
MQALEARSKASFISLMILDLRLASSTFARGSLFLSAGICRFPSKIKNQESKMASLTFAASVRLIPCTEGKGAAMVGNAVRLGVMGALALVGSMHVASSMPQCIASDPRVVALEAQWKVVNGDAAGAYKVIRNAEVRQQTAVPVSHPTQARNAQTRSTSTRS